MWSGLAIATAAACGLLGYAVRGRSAQLLGPSVHRGPGTRRALSLTFDDGPSPGTLELLEVLQRYEAKATFFQCGENVRRWPKIAKAVAQAGHEIGNHTDTHAALYLRSPEFIEQELSRAQSTILDVSGATPTLFRAPYGARWFGLRAAQRRLGLLGVMWTTIARDWVLPAPAITGRLVDGAKNGAILCLHDGRELQARPAIQPTLSAVREVLPRLQDQGYLFETVSQLLCTNPPSQPTWRTA